MRMVFTMLHSWYSQITEIVSVFVVGIFLWIQLLKRKRVIEDSGIRITMN